MIMMRCNNRYVAYVFCNLDSLLPSLGYRYEYYELRRLHKLYDVYSNNDMRSVALRVALSRQLVLISLGHVTSSS